MSENGVVKNNKVEKVPIHRLVAEAFIPNSENKPTVDHVDGNRLNNSVDNLRWATYSEQNSRFNTIGVRGITRGYQFLYKDGERITINS